NFFFRFAVDFIKFDAQVVNNKLLARRGVLAHIELEGLIDVGIVQQQRLEPAVFTNKCPKRIGRYLTESFKSGNFHLASELLHRLLLLFFTVAVYRLLLISHPKQRSFKNKHVTRFHQIGEKLQEERHQEKSDVHTIDISIRCDDDFIIPKTVQ